MHRRPIHALLLLLAAFSSMGVVCGWGAPLEGLATHCPPRTIDCGPGCIEEGATCCDDTLSGGKSQCPTAGGGVGRKCTKRGEGTCPAVGAGKYCCGESGLGGETPSTDISESTTFDGFPGVFCGNSVVASGAECCSAVDAKKLCRYTTPRNSSNVGTGGGGGGGAIGTGGGGGVTPGTCAAGPSWMGSARSCAPLGPNGSCSCSTANTNRCITKAEFDAISRPFPAACKPSGQAGCLETTSGTLVAPCCPGLTCKVGSVCGSTATGGSCVP